jgi:hypothetical protein
MVVFLVLISLLIHSTVFILTGPLKCLCGRIHITFQAPPAFTFICHDQISRRTRQVCYPAELLGSVKAGCGAEAFTPALQVFERQFHSGRGDERARNYQRMPILIDNDLWQAPCAALAVYVDKTMLECVAGMEHIRFCRPVGGAGQPTIFFCAICSMTCWTHDKVAYFPLSCSPCHVLARSTS